MGFIAGVILGAILTVLGCRWLITSKRELAVRLGLVPFADDSGLTKEQQDTPESSDPTEIAKIALIPHRDLRHLVQTLTGWSPKHHHDEDTFQRSFMRHLLTHGYNDAEIVRHPRVPWGMASAGTDEQKTAIPDFMIGGCVLVELKRNVTRSGDSDRSLGQMSRYAKAWRKNGPVLLVVCNDYDQHLRAFVEQSVREWKAAGAPIMAYFARKPDIRTGDDEFTADAWGA